MVVVIVVVAVIVVVVVDVAVVVVDLIPFGVVVFGFMDECLRPAGIQGQF